MIIQSDTLFDSELKKICVILNEVLCSINKDNKSRSILIECPNGTYGTKCTITCPPLTYGRFCGEKCDCPISLCHHMYGCSAISSTCKSNSFTHYWYDQRFLFLHKGLITF